MGKSLGREELSHSFMSTTFLDRITALPLSNLVSKLGQQMGWVEKRGLEVKTCVWSTDRELHHCYYFYCFIAVRCQNNSDLH